MSIAGEHLRRQMQDPFFKYFKQVPRPDGVMTFQRRLQVPPGASNFRDPGVTREAADIYKSRTGRAYTGALIMPVSKDPTYAKSSYAKADAAKASAAKPSTSLGGGSKPARPLRTQRSLFGGNVRDLMPSQRRDLTRRRAARASVAKTKKTLGV